MNTKNYYVTRSFIVEHPIIFLEVVGILTLGAVAAVKILHDTLRNGNVITIGLRRNESEGN